MVWHPRVSPIGFLELYGPSPIIDRKSTASSGTVSIRKSQVATATGRFAFSGTVRDHNATTNKSSHVARSRFGTERVVKVISCIKGRLPGGQSLYVVTGVRVL